MKISGKLKYGGNTLLLLFLIIGIMVLLNFLVYKHSFRWDLTENKRFSLSDQTKELLKNLDEEVQVLAFFQEGSSSERMVARLLERYQDYTDKLKVEFIDPDKNPAQARAYEVSSYGTTVFVSPKRQKKVEEYQLFTYGNNYWDQMFKGEEEFTRAISSVTSDTAAKIYFLSGHGEYSLDNELYSLKDYLQGEGYDLASINLAKDGIPEDSKLLVIAGPERDYTPQEIELLKVYGRQGGDFIFLLNPSYQTKGIVLKNLNALLQEWGITAEDTLVVDQAQSYFFDPFTPIADYGRHEITDKLSSEDLLVVLPMVRSLARVEGYAGPVEQTAILKTSSHAWGETDYTAEKIIQDEQDLKAPLNLAYALSWKVNTGDGEEETNSTGQALDKVEAEEAPALIDEEMRALVVGTAAVLTNKILPLQGNRDFILNSINWLVGQEDKISIRPKELGIRMLYLTPGASRMIFYGTVLVLPLLIFALGAVIYFRRRHL